MVKALIMSTVQGSGWANQQENRIRQLELEFEAMQREATAEKAYLRRRRRA